MREAGSLEIKWRRLMSGKETCPRCGSTEKEIDKAVSALGRSLGPLGIEVRLTKEALSVPEFKKDPLQSNRILINGRLLEDWIGGGPDIALVAMSAALRNAGLLM